MEEKKSNELSFLFDLMDKFRRCKLFVKAKHS